ncbi:hypothetical protein [Poritiphilus flavus]|uniref:Uncharacterized protein n=1 Tax=Poritiphilus flavus TaxID=2697053 RepID=A0A6L9ECI3_9FLAO|nr:hypothetical protein [Poritiphilus flavus]NAS12397.1 hypothetical protein [Poritiphilus flavus]
MKAYSSSYDDGSYSKIFYDGKKKTINFWNSDSNTRYTNIRVANIISRGKIETREVKVTTTAGSADFVFEEDYNLPTLEFIENHI